MEKVNTILIDCDGCLTNGRVCISADGKEVFKEFHSRDSRAIRELIAHGYHVVIITASDSLITKAYAKRVGAELIVSREKRFTGEYIAVGDDSWDIELLKNASQSYCPADAYKKVKDLPNIKVLQTTGGAGVIAELRDELL